MRYRLRTLLIVLAWVGLVCVGLRSCTSFWSWTHSAIEMMALATSILFIVYRAGRSRAFAVGFLVFGAAFTAFALVNGGGRIPNGMAASPARILYELIYGDWSKREMGGAHFESFLEIVHSSSAVALGVLGGMIAQMIHAAPQKED